MLLVRSRRELHLGRVRTVANPTTRRTFSNPNSVLPFPPVTQGHWLRTRYSVPSRPSTVLLKGAHGCVNSRAECVHNTFNNYRTAACSDSQTSLHPLSQDRNAFLHGNHSDGSVQPYGAIGSASACPVLALQAVRYSNHKNTHYAINHKTFS